MKPVNQSEASQTTSEWDIENLASRLHQVYQEELKRQGKKSKYSDFYTELPEDIKDLDRALARYINSFIIPNRVNQTRAETAREIKEKWNQRLKEVKEELAETSHSPHYEGIFEDILEELE